MSFSISGSFEAQPSSHFFIRWVSGLFSMMALYKGCIGCKSCKSLIRSSIFIFISAATRLWRRTRRHSRPAERSLGTWRRRRRTSSSRPSSTRSARSGDGRATCAAVARPWASGSSRSDRGPRQRTAPGHVSMMIWVCAPPLGSKEELLPRPPRARARSTVLGPFRWICGNASYRRNFCGRGFSLPGGSRRSWPGEPPPPPKGLRSGVVHPRTPPWGTS